MAPKQTNGINGVHHGSSLSEKFVNAVDAVVKPDVRAKVARDVKDVAKARPILFSFLAINLAFSFIPLLIFLTFTISTLAFSLVCALFFTLFWVGVALLVLGSALFVTVGCAVTVWVWAIGSLFVVRYVGNFLEGVKGGVRLEVPGRGTVVAEKSEGLGRDSWDGKVEEA